MNYKMVGRFLAQILTVEGLFMIPAAMYAEKIMPCRHCFGVF